MNVDDAEDDENDDEDDEDDFLEEKDDDDSDDDDEDGEEDEDDSEEPETWQVVDFPAAYCLDWPDFPAQPGWASFSRHCVADRSPRRRP